MKNTNNSTNQNNKECIYATDTPLGCCCSIVNKECMNPYVDECDEPEWEYLMRMAENYVEEDSE